MLTFRWRHCSYCRNKRARFSTQCSHVDTFPVWEIAWAVNLLADLLQLFFFRDFYRRGYLQNSIQTTDDLTDIIQFEVRVIAQGIRRKI